MNPNTKFKQEYLLIPGDYIDVITKTNEVAKLAKLEICQKNKKNRYKQTVATNRQMLKTTIWLQTDSCNQ